MSESAKDAFSLAQATELQRYKAELKTLQRATLRMTPTARYSQESEELVVRFPILNGDGYELRVERRSIAVWRTYDWRIYDNAPSLSGEPPARRCHVHNTPVVCRRFASYDRAARWKFTASDCEGNSMDIGIYLDAERRKETYISWEFTELHGNRSYHCAFLDQGWMIWTNDTFNAMCSEVDKAYHDFERKQG